jgi:cathepsin C
MQRLGILSTLGSRSSLVAADTPANCTYEDILGTWTFFETERSGDQSIDCSQQPGNRQI